MLTVVNILGVRFGGLLQNIFTIGKWLPCCCWCWGVLPTGGTTANFTTPRALLGGLALVAGIAAALQGVLGL